MVLEVIVENLREASQAEHFGVDRLEVVSAISEGGLTPSYGVIKQITENIKVPAMIMIRPHSHSFYYDDYDIAIMQEDIIMANELGAQGIVFGALTKAGDIDRDLLENVIDWKGDMDLTFHRAIEDARDIDQAYLELREYGNDITQVLTSGGGAKATDSVDRLAQWIADGKKDNNSFEILVGSGVTTENIALLHETLQNRQYHVGGGARIDGDFSKGLDLAKVKALQEAIK
ncbi:copper homeostasis protein CutC [Listeria booriae]|uniref:copper homeostasis protein CutC n=1 Tax=Listeria booriae TaxID=1552123 RepID=UPI001628B392|nr:copper homeostasis protein CutC [Listeria booriae]MBC1650374.1 copper homeostasis protein CutC [Listeria booriae]